MIDEVLDAGLVAAIHFYPDLQPGEHFGNGQGTFFVPYARFALAALI